MPSSVAIACPFCGSWLRVAAQPSKITRNEGRRPNQLHVEFDSQTVAHICKKEK